MKKLATIIIMTALVVTFMPSMVFATSVGKTTLTVKGRTLNFKAKNAKKYEVQIKYGKKFKKVKVLTAKKYKVKIKKTAGFRVRGINGKVKGKWSAVKTVKIPVKKKTSVKKTVNENTPKKEFVGKASLDVSRMGNIIYLDFDAKNAVKFEVQANENGKFKIVEYTRTKDTDYEIKKNTQFRVRGINGDEKGKWSDVLSVSFAKKPENKPKNPTTSEDKVENPTVKPQNPTTNENKPQNPTTNENKPQNPTTNENKPENPVPKEETNYYFREFRVMNQWPIYDYSVPNISGYSKNDIAKYATTSHTVYLYIDTDCQESGIVDDCLTFKNTDMNNAVCKACTQLSTNFADVEYKDRVHSALKRGGVLFPLYLEENSVKAGANHFDVFYKNTKVGSFIVNISSAKDLYENFMNNIETATFNKFPPTPSKTDVSANNEIYYKLACIATYLRLEYFEYDRLGISGWCLTYRGNEIDTNLVGCEFCADVMTLFCMKYGINAKPSYAYVNNHCVCGVSDPSVFGLESCYIDACPADNGSTNAECQSYYNSLPKVL